MVVRAILPLLVGLAIYGMMLPVAGQLLNDPDTYWHLAVARWILEHRTFPTTDPFSHTMAGEPWIAFEWLSELAYAAAHVAAGWSGVAVLAALAIALTFGLLTWFLARELEIVPTLALVTAACILTAPHLLARPHLLAMPLMVAWVGMLVRAVDRGAPPPFRLLPLIVLWANLHGSVCLGIAFIAPTALEALVQADRHQRPNVLKTWALFAILAVAAASLTPYGWQTLLMPIHTLGLGEGLSIILEWQPQNFGKLGGFEICLLSGIGYALYRGLTLPPIRIVVLIGLIHLALSQSRHADLLAMFAPLFLARPLAQQSSGASARRDSEGAPDLVALKLPVPAAVGLALAILALVAGLVATRGAAPASRNTPAAAIAATDLGNAGPILNDYGFGGYLIYAGIPPFIDGRGELYGRALMLRHHRAVTLADTADLLRLLDEYHIAATLLAPETRAVTLLDRLPGWERVYADNVAVVHRRRPPAASQFSPSSSRLMPAAPLLPQLSRPPQAGAADQSFSDPGWAGSLRATTKQ
jgi:hypothetical protein